MVAEDIWAHFGMWWAVGLWIIIYGLFLLFVPFYKKYTRITGVRKKVRGNSLQAVFTNIFVIRSTPAFS